MPKLIGLITENKNGKWQTFSKWKCDHCKFSNTSLNKVLEHGSVHFEPNRVYIVPDHAEFPVAVVEFETLEQMKQWDYSKTMARSSSISFKKWEDKGIYGLFDNGYDGWGDHNYQWEPIESFKDDLKEIISITDCLRRLIKV